MPKAIHAAVPSSHLIRHNAQIREHGNRKGICAWMSYELLSLICEEPLHHSGPHKAGSYIAHNDVWVHATEGGQ